MIELLALLLAAGVIVGAGLAVSLRSLVGAVVSAGLASLFAALSYVLLAAPDVAMTEASIGSGLSTAIFLYALRRTRCEDTTDDDQETDR